MLASILKKVFGSHHDRVMKSLAPLVSEINALEGKMSSLSNDELQAKTAEFKQRHQKGETLDELLPEAFAVCREASKRVLGMRHYDVQLIGGIVLHRGSIAEMRTGEGKTLVATLPVYLNALSGKGVHVVTVNDYLAKRDAEWMGRLYNFLGLSVGTITHELDDQARQKSYRSDITYGTNNEFGFDYLRDNMKYSLESMVQRELNYAIIDECDSILIDEARTPLIISGPSEASTDKYSVVNKVIPKLVRDVHFTMEEKTKTASLTDEGNSKVEELLGIENLYDPQNIELLHHIYQGLKAYHLYHRDVDYMVKDNEIVIVDEFTGRLMPGRRWSDGLHQAIEAKEGVPVKSENQTLASITFQNYFKLYQKIAGMTGTADTEAVEFQKIYNLSVVVIPTNRPILRKDHEDVVYKTEKAKFKAIAQDIKMRNERGQPILIGTVSIEKSELLSNHLKMEGIPHQILNAKHHEREAEIISQAGRKSAVTIATNMAGRGTDIVLGGNPEILAKREVKAEQGPEFEQALAKWKSICEKEREEVVAAGGLYIIGTERHESRRVDNQLRGRSGRQGDPGESQFYLSLEDNLMRIFNGEMVQKAMNLLKVPDDEPIVARMVTRSIESSQRKVEGHHFDIRKHLLDFDNVMNQQRTIIYSRRKKILAGENLDEEIRDMMADLATEILDACAPETQKPEDWDQNSLNTQLQKQFGVQVDFTSLVRLDSETLSQVVTHLVKDAFENQKRNLGIYLESVQKMVLLQTIDQKWKDHLKAIDRLKEGINLRGYAQKDPIIEYKKEAFTAFELLLRSIKSEVVEKFLKIQIVTPDQDALALDLRNRERELNRLRYEGASEADAGGGSFASASISNQAESSGPARRFLGRSPDQGPKMNRAQRREMEKRRR